jgi:hypothetical protein
MALTSSSAKAGGFDVVVKFGPTYYPYYPLVKPVYVTPTIYTPAYYPYYPSLYVPRPIVVTPVYGYSGFGFSKYPTFPHHHHHHKHKK